MADTDPTTQSSLSESLARDTQAEGAAVVIPRQALEALRRAIEGLIPPPQRPADGEPLAAPKAPAPAAEAAPPPGPLHAFQVGEATYRLRRPLQVSYQALSAEGTVECWVEAFSPRFVGRGRSAAEALSGWQDAVHAAFQALLRTRPFRMTEAQKDDWQLLERLIDVEDYWRTTPVILHDLGFVSAAGPGPRQVAWLDGGRVEEVALSQMPAEFAAYAAGQWFEAVVEREPQTYRLRRVRSVRPVEQPPRLSGPQLEDWYRALPKVDTLPKSDVSWATL